MSEWLSRYRFSVIELWTIGSATTLVYEGFWITGIVVCIVGSIGQVIAESSVR